MLNLANDLNVFFKEFQTEATFNNASLISGIFDAETLDDEFTGVSAERAMFTCKTSDVTSKANAIDKALRINSVEYLIRDAMLDVDGLIIALHLERQ